MKFDKGDFVVALDDYFLFDLQVLFKGEIYKVVDAKRSKSQLPNGITVKTGGTELIQVSYHGETKGWYLAEDFTLHRKKK
jgi:hypothetical protein